MHPKIKTSKLNILISPLNDTNGNGFISFASKLLSNNFGGITQMRDECFELQREIYR